MRKMLVAFCVFTTVLAVLAHADAVYPVGPGQTSVERWYHRYPPNQPYIKYVDRPSLIWWRRMRGERVLKYRYNPRYQPTPQVYPGGGVVPYSPYPVPPYAPPPYRW